jgi:hypothetical protein
MAGTIEPTRFLHVLTSASDSRPKLVTRRQILTIGAGLFLLGGGSAAYARFVEPAGSLALARHALTPRGWTPGLKLRIVALADFHCGSAHMPRARVAEIVEIAHAMEPDVIVLLGDYVSPAHRNVHELTPRDWAPELARLKAPLGVHAVMGNHEYWDDPATQTPSAVRPFAWAALEQAGIAILENRAVRLTKDGRSLWLAGLGDQLAYRVGHTADGRWRFEGRDDLPGTLAQIPDDAPVIMLAHEPDVFARMPQRVALTVSGHTHGGQVRLFGWSPYVPSEFGSRYAHGRITENGRDVIVSAGLGTSGPPIRFGIPPEIVVIDLG